MADIPTFREIWDGAAVFAPADDPAAFRAALAGLVAADDGRERLGQLARERAEGFTLDRQIAGLLSAYAQAARHARERRPVLAAE